VVVDDGSARRAEAYDLERQRGTTISVTDGRVQALYFNDTLEALDLKPGPLTLVEPDDLLGKELPIADLIYQAERSAGLGDWVEIPKADPVYYRYRDSALISGSVRRWASVEPLDGVQVCVYGTPEVPCAETLAGQFLLSGVVPGTNVVLSLSRVGFLPTLVMVSAEGAENDIAGSIFVISESQRDAIQDSVQATVDLQGAGLIDFITLAGLGSPVEGVAGTLEPNSGQTYTHFAGGMIASVAPGDYELTLDHPNRQFCGPSGNSFNWVGRRSNQVRLRVIAGYVTHLQGLICTSN